jgi:DNA polymerase-3 subunit alpha
MDFLGLKTLSIIKEAVANIKYHTGKDIDIDNIPIDDPATYKLYSEGRTIGTFQFESAGMQKYLRELQPTTFEDLIAMNALYRPGPMDYIPSFINRKHGREPITYDIPCMEKYLKDTYGITVYQEQVMLLSRLLANFTRGESDALRKAMGKKLKEKLDHMKPKFIEGGKKNGHNPKVLEKIWADWEKFASYAFNKSHATCYSWIAYQTAYLKANYPSEYMAAVMSRSLANITDITKLMDECKAMGINTLGPSVNESNLKFTVTSNGDIRFGMGAVKGVGEGAVATIVSEREKSGPYKSIFDFVQRVNLSSCNRKNLECLAQAGGFDCFPEITREHFFVKNAKNESFSEVLVRYGNKLQADKETVTNSLFGGDAASIEIAVPALPECTPWTDIERLNLEKDLVGIYISAHPLDEYAVILNNVCNTKVTEFDDKEALAGREMTFGGMITNVRKGTTRTGNPYAIMKVEDFSGSGELPFFGNDFITWNNFLQEGLFIYVRAVCQPRKWNQDEYEIHINSIQLLPEVKDSLIQKLTIMIPLSKLTGETVADLQEVTTGTPGNVDLHFCIYDDEDTMQSQTVEMRSRIKKISMGKNLVRFLKEHDEFRYQIN